MNFLTESELREMWNNGRGSLPSFPPGTRFSASAQDFIKSNQLEIKYLVDSANNSAQVQPPGWDKPANFPVFLEGPLPICVECGQPLKQKPEYMTQIDAGHFGLKTNPRLVFRGKLDSLNALLMLTASIARRFELPELASHLDTLAAFCREILSAEYHFRPVATLSMIGMNEDQLHDISHWPDKYLGIQHVVPGPFDHEIMHWLNLLRTQVRETELIALQIFTTGDSGLSNPGASFAHALNRLSSAVYVLELYLKAGKLSWKVLG